MQDIQEYLSPRTTLGNIEKSPGLVSRVDGETAKGLEKINPCPPRSTVVSYFHEG